VLNSESGVEEIDGKDIREGRAEEEIQRFDGALDTLAYILDVYLRRYYNGDTPMNKLLFKAISNAAVLEKLNKEEDFMPTSTVYSQILAFMASLPIPSRYSKEGAKLTDEQAKVMKVCFAFIHKFFLEFESKQDGRAALLNLL